RTKTPALMSGSFFGCATSADGQTYQPAEPGQDRKRREALNENCDTGNNDEVADYAVHDALWKRRVGRLVVRRPRKCRLPLVLGDRGGPDFFQGHPGAVSFNAAVA